MNANSVVKKGNTFFICLFSLIIYFISPNNIDAQRPARSFGIGFQAGNPTGLSLQFYKSRGVSTDILMAYDLNDFFFLNVHGLWNAHLDQGGHFHFFYGPGAFVGIRNYDPEIRDDDVVAGLSGNFGLNFVISRIEFFAQVTPRIEITPGTHYTTGGGAGIRFFF